ncbi:PAS domain-containing hybrid sensor histidine kinase/response regulator [Hymenobacter actinosclerus]|uniref:histidine kinase n=1 Tax=Hymenobacter actinosclerus TaxID=82805 RepID=A0A1H9ZEJ1_9BACT|nr:PAS domain-containing hybrid sensor histidine kinase/response regulator [Hymenobacter actinosclerus]SES79994.1 PAS domain S-box-containing protein [Hymenobacter actinosclerus]
MDSIRFRQQARQLRQARQQLAVLRQQLAAATEQAAAATRLYDALPSFIFVFDLPSGSLHYCNRFAEARLGYPAAELRAMGPRVLEVLMPAAEADTLRHHYAKVAALPDGELLSFEYNMHHRSGATRWLRLTSAPFARDAQGGVTQVLSNAEDITRWKITDEQRRSANRRLAEQNRLFRQVIDTVPNLIYLKDRAGNYVLANEATARFYDLSHEELLRAALPELEARFPSMAQYRRQDEQVLRSGQEIDEEATLTDGQGGQRWFRTVKRPFVLTDGTVQVLGVDNDITELKCTQQALERAKEAAEQNAQARQNFLTNMSHEIRTPLNGIMGLTGLLAKTPLAAEQQQLLAHVQDSADNLLVLINDVLDMAQLGAGRMRLECVPFELDQVLRACCQALLATATAKGIGLRLQLPPPAAAGPARVLGDPYRLRQVLLNLLGNAVKFTPKGQVLLTYECLDPAAATPQYRFSVLDTGIGIAPAQLRELFEPFTQASASTAREFGGSGLGLSIAQGLVALLGGQLTADSEPNKGSAFRFTLALAPAPAAPPAPPAPAPDFRRLRGYRVLLAEDNAVNQLLVQTMLRGWGVEVDTASSGREALALFRQHAYAVVLMDIQMPGLDGVATTQLLRQHPHPARAATPVVALTAHAMPGDAEHYRAAGLDAYLAKPFREEALFELLTDLLRPAPAARPAQPTPPELPAAGPGPAASPPAPTPAPAERPALYSLTQLRRLSGNDEVFVRRLVHLFVETTPPAVERLEQHLRRRQPPELAAAAHFLKSSAEGLQLASLRPVLLALEAAAATPTPPDWPQLGRLVGQVSVTVAEVVQQLREEFPA